MLHVYTSRHSLSLYWSILSSLIKKIKENLNSSHQILRSFKNLFYTNREQKKKLTSHKVEKVPNVKKVGQNNNLSFQGSRLRESPHSIIITDHGKHVIRVHRQGKTIKANQSANKYGGRKKKKKQKRGGWVEYNVDALLVLCMNHAQLAFRFRTFSLFLALSLCFFHIFSATFSPFSFFFFFNFQSFLSFFSESERERRGHVPGGGCAEK